MNAGFRFRLLLLIAAISCLAALLLWGVERSWRQISDLEQTLTVAQLESFHLADEFQRRLLKLNNLMLRFATGQYPDTWKQFEEASADLNRWDEEQYPRLSSERERELLDELNVSFESYLAAARQVYSNQPPAVSTNQLLSRLAGFEESSRELLGLGMDLGEAHRQAKEAFLGKANRSLSHFQRLLVLGVLLLMALMALLGRVIYLDMIAPLRTRLVQSQALLERQEKLATLGTLAAGIAHEIRNPLTSIKARLYTLCKHITTNPPGLADAKVIGNEIGRLEHIVQDVLSFARPSEPKRIITPADLPVREVYSLMADTLDKESVHLVLDNCDNVSVSMDAGLVKQVLINLIRNAAEATESGGTVTLRVRTDHANLQGVERQVAILEVADTGKGIPKEVEARLFDPFFTTKEAGTGLGLAIAARIVEKHGGALQYQTQVGRGTTFGIVLPIAIPGADDKNSIERIA